MCEKIFKKILEKFVRFVRFKNDKIVVSNKVVVRQDKPKTTNKKGKAMEEE